MDVAISVYGKPYQTAVTLASLLDVSGEHIDRIVFHEELQQPYGDPAHAVASCFPGRNLQHYRSRHWLYYDYTRREQLTDRDFRLSLRYQYAWETTDKNFLFLTHNDCLYQSDIIGGMLDRLKDETYTGVGMIGQCWNCPAHFAGRCNGDIYESYRPDYAEALQLIASHPGPRTKQGGIDPASPMPLPECRLNEFGCLINVARCRDQVMPLGPVMPFGAMNVDVGTDWFRGLVLQGHRFLNWSEGLWHTPFSPNGNGHAANTDRHKYDIAESRAKAYLAAHYPAVFDRLTESLNTFVLWPELDVSNARPGRP